MAIDRTNIQNIYPLTPLQEGIYFHAESDARSDAYFEQWTFRVEGRLDAGLVRQAWDDLFARHEVFRSVFTPGDGKRPLQVVLRRREMELLTKDLSDLPAHDQEAQVERERAGDRARGFELATDPLVRLILIALGPDRHVMIWSHHHVILDGWSAAVVQAEFLELYAARQRGRSPRLEPAPSFAHFVKALPSRIDADFWRGYLADYSHVARLPQRRDAGSSGLGRDYVDLSGATSAQLDAFCRREAVTIGAFVQAVWGVVLSRYAYSDDVVFGYVVSGRQAAVPGIERMVGLLINTLPIRVRLQAGESFRDLVARMHQHAADLAARQQTPLVEIQRARGTTDPLISHVVAIENHPAPHELGSADALDTGFRIVDAESYDRTHYSFDLVVLPALDHMRIRLSWDRAVHDDDAMIRLGRQVRHAIEQVLARPEVEACGLDILPPDEWTAVVETPNQTVASYPADRSIVDVFEAQVAARRDETALVVPHERASRVSYGELGARAAAVAAMVHYDLGVPAGARVAVVAAPGSAAIVAMLGVLRAGCAYVPIDPRYPPDRIRFMLEDAQVAAVLTTGEDGSLAIPTGVPVVDVARAVNDARPVPRLAEPDDPAYVIYTSGSTGRPKGCVVTHRNVVRLMINDRHDFPFGPSDTWILAHSLSFDFSVWEMYGALLYGGRLIVPSREIVRDVPAFHATVAAYRVTVLNQTPLAFASFIAAEGDASTHDLETHLRYVIFGGDRLVPASLRPWIGHYPPDRVALINMFGITETTVHVTWCRLSADQILTASGGSPIGRPIPETTVYVCDRHFNPQPVGAVGEMLVGGTGVCAGYLDRPELTAERFIPDRFLGAGRLYRSGDLAVRDASGSLHYVGRNDHQVKIRGHRVEPGEIERALASVSGVEQAAVMVDTGAAGDELTACVTGTIDAASVRSALGPLLPDYMVPANIVVCGALPLTSNGKLDRAKVRSLVAGEAAAGDVQVDAPSGEIERVLAEIWSDVLQRSRVSRHDRFISLGGDSIKAIQVLARLRTRGLNLELREMLRTPTIAALAPKVTTRCATPAKLPESDAPFPLTPIQYRFFEEHADAGAHFNHAVLLHAREPLDDRRVRDAIQALAGRHDALRLRFERNDAGVWRQRVAPAGDRVPFTAVDLRTSADRAGEIVRLSTSEHLGIDLTNGPVFRAVFFQCADGDRLLLVAHHLAVDGVTWRILQDDLGALLQHRPLAPTTDSYRQWVSFLHDDGVRRQVSSELPYWRSMDVPPSDGSSPVSIDPGQYRDAVEELAEWDEDRTADLQRACAAYQTNVGELILAAAIAALGRWTGRQQLHITVEGHGRQAFDGVDVTRTAGWFTALYPLVFKASDQAVGLRIKQVKEEWRRVPSSGAGYGVLRYLAPAPDAAGLEGRPAVSFNYLGDFSAADSGGLFTPINEPLGAPVDPDAVRPFAIEIAGIIVKGRLMLSLVYSGRGIDRAVMRGVRLAIENELRAVVEHCLSRRAPELTPSDLTHKALSLQELDDLFDDDN